VDEFGRHCAPIILGLTRNGCAIDSADFIDGLAKVGTAFCTFGSTVGPPPPVPLGETAEPQPALLGPAELKNMSPHQQHTLMTSWSVARGLR
jgi:hypothetical protein